MPRTEDYFAQGVRVVSSGAAGVTSAIVGTGRLGVQWKTNDRIFYGGTVRALTGATATQLFVFDASAVPANGTVGAGFLFNLPVTGTVPVTTAITGIPAGGLYFANGICIVGSTTDFPTLTIANANLSIAFYYGRVT